MIKFIVSSKSTYFGFVVKIALFLTTLYVFKLNSIAMTYYTYEQMFGPLSNPIVLVVYVIFITFSVISSIISRPGALDVAITLALVFTAKFVLPQYFDLMYAENFYDAGGHMVRGSYVAITGRSNPEVDMYFDIQPAFFWWTAVFVNILFGPQSSPDSYVFSFLVKWFNIIILCVYLPILTYVYRELGLSFRDSLLGFSVFALMSLTRYHYSAQVYSWAIYWLLFLLCASLVSKSRSPYSIAAVALIYLAPLTFIHQGTSLFALTTLMGIVMVFTLPIPLLSAIVNSSRRNLLIFLLAFLGIAWLTYLMYLTIYTFGNFVHTLSAVVEAVLERGVFELAVGSTIRPYEKWHTVVILKAAYMISTLTISALILLFYSYRGETLSKALLAGMAFFTSFVGLIALALGGAGYIERVYESLLPFIAYSLIRAGRSTSKIGGRVYTITLSLLCVCGSILYFAGWNFQSIAHSELTSLRLLRDFGPNIASVYSELCVIFYPEYPYRRVLDSDCLLMERAHNYIQAIYYLLGDPRLIEADKLRFRLAYSLVYSSETTYLYAPGSSTVR